MNQFTELMLSLYCLGIGSLSIAGALYFRFYVLRGAARSWRINVLVGIGVALLAGLAIFLGANYFLRFGGGL